MGQEKCSSLVESIAGHDAGTLYYVLNVEGEWLWLSDGKKRKQQNPKRKRGKHVMPLGEFEHPVMLQLQNGESVSNDQLRRALAAFRDKRA